MSDFTGWAFATLELIFYFEIFYQLIKAFQVDGMSTLESKMINCLTFLGVLNCLIVQFLSYFFIIELFKTKPTKIGTCHLDLNSSFIVAEEFYRLQGIFELVEIKTLI